MYLKRLIVGGYEGVFEFAKDFRNEGMSRFHNPEFTMMELYVAYKDYYWMMDFMEEMIEYVAMEVHGTTEVQVGDNTIALNDLGKGIQCMKPLSTLQVSTYLRWMKLN